MTAGESAAILSFAHTLLYGVYLTSLAHCLRWLVFDTEGRKLRPRIPWPTVMVTLLLFILSTGNAAVVLWMTLVAIGDQGPSAYNATYVWSAALGTAVLLVVDAVLIFRCWLVYSGHSKKWLIMVIPLVLWLTDFVSGIIGLVLLEPNSPFPGSFVNSPGFLYMLSDLNMIFLICEIVINLYVTPAIVIRILRISRWNVKQTSGRSVHDIGRIIAGSGFLFTVTCIVNLLFKALALNIPSFQLSSLIMGSININAATISFNLVLIRMAQERSQERPHVVTDLEESNEQQIFTTLPFEASTYNSTQDGSTIPDIEMQVTSSRVIRAEDLKL